MDTRTRILDAALGLAAAGGVQELTQPRIARAAGVRQSHLTYYFPTIADLLQAVARHMVDAAVAEVRAKAPGRRPAALTNVFARVATEPRRARVMLALVVAADRDPALKPRLRRLVRELRAGIAAALASAGIVADPEDVAFLHAAVVGSAVLHLARTNAEARREVRAVLGRAIAAVGGED
jgi:AcrR family transcriptional regulator